MFGKRKRKQQIADVLEQSERFYISALSRIKKAEETALAEAMGIKTTDEKPIELMVPPTTASEQTLRTGVNIVHSDVNMQNIVEATPNDKPLPLDVVHSKDDAKERAAQNADDVITQLESDEAMARDDPHDLNEQAMVRHNLEQVRTSSTIDPVQPSPSPPMLPVSDGETSNSNSDSDSDSDSQSDSQSDSDSDRGSLSPRGVGGQQDIQSSDDQSPLQPPPPPPPRPPPPISIAAASSSSSQPTHRRTTNGSRVALSHVEPFRYESPRQHPALAAHRRRGPHATSDNHHHTTYWVRRRPAPHRAASARRLPNPNQVRLHSCMLVCNDATATSRQGAATTDAPQPASNVSRRQNVPHETSHPMPFHACMYPIILMEMVARPELAKRIPDLEYRSVLGDAAARLHQRLVQRFGYGYDVNGRGRMRSNLLIRSVLDTAVVRYITFIRNPHVWAVIEPESSNGHPSTRSQGAYGDIDTDEDTDDDTDDANIVNRNAGGADRIAATVQVSLQKGDDMPCNTPLEHGIARALQFALAVKYYDDAHQPGRFEDLLTPIRLRVRTTEALAHDRRVHPRTRKRVRTTIVYHRLNDRHAHQFRVATANDRGANASCDPWWTTDVVGVIPCDYNLLTTELHPRTMHHRGDDHRGDQNHHRGDHHHPDDGWNDDVNDRVHNDDGRAFALQCLMDDLRD